MEALRRAYSIYKLEGKMLENRGRYLILNLVILLVLKWEMSAFIAAFLLCVYIIMSGIEKQEFSLISIMPFRTKDIINAIFVEKYILVSPSIIIFLILAIIGKINIYTFMVILSIFILSINLIIWGEYDQEMSVDREGGIMLLLFLLSLFLGIIIFYGFSKGFNPVTAIGKVTYIITSILLSVGSSYTLRKGIITNIYKGK